MGRHPLLPFSLSPSGHLDRYPPLGPAHHTLTTRPFPAPSRASTGLRGTQEDGVPGLWCLRTHKPSPATSPCIQGGSQPTSRSPCIAGASFRGTVASSGDILRVSLFEDRGSTERKHGSRAGFGFFARTVQAWRTMEQLSSFLHRGSFVPPFPPAWLSLAKRQRLLGSLRAKAQTFP